jgi:serine phosphatase RsbU (regulator of sigma subunit)
VLEWANALGPSIRAFSAQDIVDALLAEVRAFAGGAPQSDDITVLVLRRTA